MVLSPDASVDAAARRRIRTGNCRVNTWAQQRETELRLRTWMAWNRDVITTRTP
jgi:hypothetical protein